MRPLTLSQLPISCQAPQISLKLRLKAVLSRTTAERVYGATLIGLICLIGLIGPISADAKFIAKAEKIIQSDSRLIMNPGEMRTVKVGFKNFSPNVIWRRESKNYASLYPVGPRNRKSVFVDKSWMSKEHVTRVAEKQVKHGEIGYFEFRLKAPDVIGDYTEDFGIALENLAWVDGAIFELRISVVPKGAHIQSAEKNNQNLASPHEAVLLLASQKSLSLKSGDTANLKFGFKNIGKTVWNTRGLRSLATVRIAAVENTPRTDWFQDETPVYIKDQPPVKPGELGFIDLPIRAPVRGGNYTLRLALIVDDQIVNGGEIELPVEVIEEAAPTPLPQAEFVPVMQEPMIRVGLQQTKNDPILITADQPFEVRDGLGTLYGVVGAGVVAITRFDFSTNIYSVESGDVSYSGAQYVRFLPTIPGTIFEIKSMVRHPYFSKEVNDNKYRGALEVRLSDIGNLWTINELKIEDYLFGLAEARDSAPLDFQKAQAIAARSFAYYIIANGGKYKKGYFDVTWTTDDQAYRGYNSEARMQNLVRGVMETRGEFVMYDGKVVTTPYFAQSNGRTKLWSQVWGGKDKPWLQPVPAPADEGKRQRGHGVGMSQIDAIWRADQGANYQEILKYYYTGIEVKKLY